MSGKHKRAFEFIQQEAARAESASPMKTSQKALALCHAIEAAGASEQLTKCSVLASEIRTEVIAIEAAAARGADKAVEFPEPGSKAWIDREVERAIEKGD